MAGPMLGDGRSRLLVLMCGVRTFEHQESEDELCDGGKILVLFPTRLACCLR